ncbi:putative chromate transport protein [Bdellovibrio bacteriovorus]|uniref:chromate efflux transporter n=1 Tax=Bdellovibrio bacteriovorus TaxID=959 RepID=UPI00045BF25C|nr:chromate efflux transporter [Bdellovibrio bacteriovorus]AHZ84344.1 chromate transport protein [Bdellovibrio bacteriovorus]BEV68232.1 putative chromate transport protein [Bdellovibrio bacteriovorus]
MAKSNPESSQGSLRELAWIFLKLGATSFGGPAAHISLMEEEFVHRRQWVTRAEFLELLALTNLIPGPNSTELAIHLGHRRAGWSGLVVAGVCFILPAFLLVTLIAAFYVHFAKLPQMESFLTGVKAVVLAVILQASSRFLLSLLKVSSITSNNLRENLRSLRAPSTVFLLLLVVISALLHSAGMAEIPLLLAGGILALPLLKTNTRLWNAGALFWVFFKVGSVLFGSGYVLLSFLKTELIEKRGWLTETQLMDAIAVGQFTPGPVFTTASFIGYLLQGPSGALIATVGIFLPAFVFVALSIPAYQWMKKSEPLKQFLQGVVAVSVGLLFSTLVQLGRDALVTPLSWGLFLVSLVLLRRRLPSAALILAGGILTLLLQI